MIHAVIIFFVMTAAMLLSDTIYTVQSKANASGKVFVATSANVIGEAVTTVMRILTISIVAKTAYSSADEIAQVLGNMMGGGLGVIIGGHVSILLDRFVQGFHKRPAPVRVETIENAMRKIHGRTKADEALNVTEASKGVAA